MAARHDVGLAVAERLAPGDADHLLDEVDAGDHLGHGMLHLDAGVHLDEEELARRVVVEVFERAGAAVTAGLGQPDRGTAERRAGLIGQARRGSLLPDLLAAALQRAFPLAEMDGGAPVAQDLDFDVSGAADEAFEVEAAVTEGGLGLGRGLRQQRREFVGVACDPDAAPAASRRRLDHHGKSDPGGDGRSGFEQ